MYVYVSSDPCFYLVILTPETRRGEAVAITNATAIIVILGWLLTGQLQWWSVLLGLMLWWAAEYTL